MHFFTFTLLFTDNFQFIEPLKQHPMSVMMQMKTLHASFNRLVKVLDQWKSSMWMRFIDSFAYDFVLRDC